eukprot:PLAT5512.1.p1 GENE.PLAT5512.1~~PLAT5512.1.p1  ORF type:complete len:137 (-),score=68.24 PLAT5512.1:137-547(-)
MWPDHCVQGSAGADFHSDLLRGEGDVVVRKGTKRIVDSYSGFGDAFEGKHEETELADVLRAAGATDVYCVGLATDFCVSFTAKDAARVGFTSSVVFDAARGISEEGIERERKAWAEAGVRETTVDAVIAELGAAAE